MIAVARWIRSVLVGTALIVFPAGVSATDSSGKPVEGSTTGLSEHRPANAPAGSPEFGILIIIGVVGLLVLIAWIFSRAGDDSRSSGDSSLV